MLALVLNARADFQEHWLGMFGVWLFFCSSFFGVGLMNNWAPVWHQHLQARFPWLKRIPFILGLNILLVFIQWRLAMIITLWQAFPMVSDQSFRSFVRFLLGTTFSYSIFAWLRNRNRFDRLQLQHVKLRNENLLAQFEILKQQINPHFLFNALSTLRSMIREGHEHSEEYVIKLSEIMREALRQKDKDAVSLEEELHLLRSYLFLLEARFETGLLIQQDISPTLLSFKMPAFALQLLIENCIKHNVVSENKPLTIRIYSTDNKSVTVENNLQRKQSQAEPSGYGLPNLRERYRLLGIENSLQVMADDTHFSVQIPLLAP